MPAPSALSPWQEEQPRAKISFPSAIKVALSDELATTLVVSARAILNPTPTMDSAIIKSTGAANRCLRYRERYAMVI
jgi:hypothetical protein